MDEEGRVSKCVSCNRGSISGSNFALNFLDLEILAVVACAQYKHLCLCCNNSEVSSVRPIILSTLVQNIYLCTTLASNA